MAATITECLKTGALSWRYEWTGTAPFNVYMHGSLFLANTENTFLDVVWETDSAEHRAEPPPIEVIDSTQTAAALKQVLYPPTMELQFRGQANAEYYKAEVSFDDGSNWTSTNIAETGRGYYRVSIHIPYTFDILIRVSAIDSQGVQGDYMQFSLFHHSVSTPPAFTYTYDSGTGLVTAEVI